MLTLVGIANAQRHWLIGLLIPTCVLLIPAIGTAGKRHRHHHHHHGHRHIGFSLGRYGGLGLHWGFRYRHFPYDYRYSYPRYLSYSYAYPRHWYSYRYGFNDRYSNGIYAYAYPHYLYFRGTDCLPDHRAVYRKENIAPEQEQNKIVPNKESDSQENQDLDNPLQEGNSGSGVPTRFETAKKHSLGWELLAEGRPATAQRAFAFDAARDVSNGIHKVGYSLAAAASGDLSGGVWAMRRASQVDPTSIYGLHVDSIDPRLREIVKQLSSVYEDRLKRRIDRTGSAFMLGSLHFLDRKDQRAQQAIAQAIGAGDQSISTHNLRRSLDVRSAQPEPGVGTSFNVTKVSHPRRPDTAVPRDLSTDGPSIRLTPRIAGGREF